MGVMVIVMLIQAFGLTMYHSRYQNCEGGTGFLMFAILWLGSLVVAIWMLQAILFAPGMATTKTNKKTCCVPEPRFVGTTDARLASERAWQKYLQYATQ